MHGFVAAALIAMAPAQFAPYGLLERIEAGLPRTVDTDAMIVG